MTTKRIIFVSPGDLFINKSCTCLGSSCGVTTNTTFTTQGNNVIVRRPLGHKENNWDHYYILLLQPRSHGMNNFCDCCWLFVLTSIDHAIMGGSWVNVGSFRASQDANASTIFARIDVF